MATIMVVDDRDDMRSMLSLFLERASHKVSGAPDCKAALERFRRGPPELVLTDLLTPGRDGLALIREIHTESPDTKIIAISVDSDGLHEARRCGACRALLKPVSPLILLLAIEEVLNNGR